MFKESKNLEFKEKMTDSFLKTVSAFANFGTGTILFGVNKEGDIVGVDDMQKLRLDIENSINDNINPIPDYILEDDEKNKIVKLIVREGLDKPYFYKSKTYMRKDTSSVEVDSVNLTRLILEGKRMFYDMLKSQEKELTFNILEKKLKEKIGIDSFNLDTLKTFGLYNNVDGYNIAAELLADKNNDCGIDIVRFGKNINIILDRVTVDHVSIIEQYDKALEMFRHYYVYEEIKHGERVKIEKIPENAYREAVANALVHRTWDDNANINISFYDDRIEILSPGGLPNGMTEKEYLEDKVSRARNPHIAYVFLRLDLMERLGTGVQRIIAEYDYSKNKPKFKISDSLIVVTLPLLGSTTQETTLTTPYTTSKDEDTTPKKPQGNLKETPKKPQRNPKESEILKLMLENPCISVSEMSEELKWTIDSTQHYINKLKEENVIKHEGSTKAGKWVVLKED